MTGGTLRPFTRDPHRSIRFCNPTENHRRLLSDEDLWRNDCLRYRALRSRRPLLRWHIFFCFTAMVHRHCTRLLRLCTLLQPYKPTVRWRTRFSVAPRLDEPRPQAPTGRASRLFSFVATSTTAPTRAIVEIFESFLRLGLTRYLMMPFRPVPPATWPGLRPPESRAHFGPSVGGLFNFKTMSGMSPMAQDCVRGARFRTRTDNNGQWSNLAPRWLGHL